MRNFIAPGHLSCKKLHDGRVGAAVHRGAGIQRHSHRRNTKQHRCAGSYQLCIRNGHQRFSRDQRHGPDIAGRTGCACHREGGTHDGVIVLRIGAQCPQHGFIPDQRRVGVDQGGSTAVVLGKVFAEHDLAHVNGVLSPLGRRDIADNGFIGELEAAVGHMQVPMGYRNIHRLHNRSAGDVDGGCHVIQLLQVVEILYAGRTTYPVEVINVGRAVGRRDHHGFSADGNGALRIPTMMDVLRRRFGYQGEQGVTTDADPGAIDFGLCLFPGLNRLCLTELNTDFLNNPHRGFVNLFDTFCARHLI